MLLISTVYIIYIFLNLSGIEFYGLACGQHQTGRQDNPPGLYFGRRRPEGVFNIISRARTLVVLTPKLVRAYMTRKLPRRMDR